MVTSAKSCFLNMQQWFAVRERTDFFQELHADQTRSKEFVRPCADLIIDFTRNKIDLKRWKVLQSFAHFQDLCANLENILSAQNGCPLPLVRDCSLDCANLQSAQITKDRTHLFKLCTQVHQGELKGGKGDVFTDVLHLGIGGSCQGSKLFWNALSDIEQPKMRMHFVSNLLTQKKSRLLESLDPNRTLVLVVSKSFTTEETLRNLERIRAWQSQTGTDNSANNFAVTSFDDLARERGFDENHILSVPTWIAGRFGVWSSLGAGIALGFGVECYQRILSGGAKIDSVFAKQKMQHAAVALALVDFWQRNIEKNPAWALCPQDSRLEHFSSYIQQLEMESNGKYVNKGGSRLDYCSAPIVFGAAGTEGEHSFFQHLHQGMILSYTDFLCPFNEVCYELSDRDYYLRNTLSQAQQLMSGTPTDQKAQDSSMEMTRSTKGGRSSAVILYPFLCADVLGQLIAFYEYRTLAYSALLHLNPFDQWGVEAAKVQKRHFINYDPLIPKPRTKNTILDWTRDFPKASFGRGPQ